MKVFVKGLGDINLTKSDFLASGGQGDVYIKGDTAFKIYHDPNNMIPNGKFNELAKLSHSDIIKPKELILSGRKTVGYTMRYVEDTYALCQLFTKAFRDRNGLSPQTSFELVRKLQNIIQHVHNNGILIVDLNELNFLASKKFDAVYAIDVDSYQTPSYPATAIMDSIRDRHSSKFTKETDWFSFAIISFMMMIGIHPYKGKHPAIKGLDDRMLKNISVFNKDVSIPKSCLPMDVIPEVYVKWYQAVFERGLRASPPVDPNAVAQLITVIHKTIGSNNFDIKQLKEFASSIIDITWAGTHKTTLLDTGEVMLNDKVALRDIPVSAKIGTSLKNVIPIAAYTEHDYNGKDKIKLRNVLTGGEIAFTMLASELMEYDGRIYFKSGINFIEIQLNEIGNDIIASPFPVANVMEHSSKAYDGVLIQDMLGAMYVSIFPHPRVHQQIRIPELEDYKIVDAKHDKGVLIVVGIGEKKRQYDKLIFRFSSNWQEYDLRKIENISYTAGINFVTLDNGICIHIDDEENVEVFRNVMGLESVRVIKDPAINDDMKLFSSGATTLLALGNKLHSITMKKGP